MQRYQAPRRLNRGSALLPCWERTQLEPTVMIRRVTLPDQPLPSQPDNSALDPEEKEPVTNTLPIETEDGESDLVGELLRELEQEGAIPDWHEDVAAELPELDLADLWSIPAYEYPTTDEASIQERITAARRDLDSARELIESAGQHLNGIEACVAMNSTSDV